MPADQGSTYGPQAPFTAENDASATAQGQHTMSNDHPVDVNNNAILARLQGQTAALAGAEFEAAASRRTIFADKDVKPST